MPRFLPLLLLLLPAVFLTACGERKADVEQLKTFKSRLLTFQYPGNWKATKLFKFGKQIYIMVESPGDTVVIINGMPAKDAGKLEDYAREFAREAEVDLPLVPVKSSGVKADGDGGFVETLTFFFLGDTDTLTRNFREAVFGDYKVFIILQYADEDLELIGKGLDVIQQSVSPAPPKKNKKNRKKKGKPEEAPPVA